MSLDFNSPEIIELKAACAARLRELDKAFKACVKGGIQGAADKVNDRIKTVRDVAARLEAEE